MAGINIGNIGTGALVVTVNMSIYSNAASDDTHLLWAIDKRSGEIVGEIDVPARNG